LRGGSANASANANANHLLDVLQEAVGGGSAVDEDEAVQQIVEVHLQGRGGRLARPEMGE
jgi:hypothetical protein